MLKAGEILTMNRTDLVLAEFSNSDPFDYICQGIQQLQMKGFEVILAHVERYACMYKSPDYVEHLTHMGVKIQINADSITGWERLEGEALHKEAPGTPAGILCGHRRPRCVKASAAHACGRGVRGKEMRRRICEEIFLQQCESQC